LFLGRARFPIAFQFSNELRSGDFYRRFILKIALSIAFLSLWFIGHAGLAAEPVLEKALGLSSEELKGKLPTLEVLDLTGLPVSDVGFLASVPRLKELRLTVKGKVDLSALKSLADLKSLSLEGEGEVNFSPLGATTLQRLSISGMSYRQFSNLFQLTSLQDLSLTKVKDLEVEEISFLINLVSLDLTGTRISGTSALARLVNLEKLTLKATDIRDVKGIDELAWLQQLDVSENPLLKDISSLDKMPKLKTLVKDEGLSEELKQLHSHLKKFLGHTFSKDKETINAKKTTKSVLNRSSTLRGLTRTQTGVRFEELVQIRQKKWSIDESGATVGAPVTSDREYRLEMELKLAPTPLKGIYGFLRMREMSPIGGALSKEDLTGEIFTIDKATLEKDLLEYHLQSNSIYPWPNTPEPGVTLFKDALNLRFEAKENQPLTIEFRQESQVIDPTTGAILKTEEPWVIRQE